MPVFKFIDTVSVESSSGQHPASPSGEDGAPSPRKFSVDKNQSFSINEKGLKKKKSFSFQGSVLLDLKSTSSKRRGSHLGLSVDNQLEYNNMNAGRDHLLNKGPNLRLSSVDQRGKVRSLAPSLNTLKGPTERKAADLLASHALAVGQNKAPTITYSMAINGEQQLHDPSKNTAYANLKCFQKLTSASSKGPTSKFTQQDSLCLGGPPTHSANIRSRFGMNTGTHKYTTLASQVSGRLHPQLSVSRDDAVSRADTGLFHLHTKSLLQVQGLGAEIGETIELDQQGQASEESARESSKKRYQPKVEKNLPLRLDTNIDLGYELSQSEQFTNYMKEREERIRLVSEKLAEKYQSGGTHGVSKSVIRETTADEETMRASQKFPTFEGYPSMSNKQTSLSISSNQQLMQAPANTRLCFKMRSPEPCSSPIPASLEFKNSLTDGTGRMPRVTLSMKPMPKIARSIELKTLRKRFLQRSSSPGISLAMGPSF